MVAIHSGVVKLPALGIAYLKNPTVFLLKTNADLVLKGLIGLIKV